MVTYVASISQKIDCRCLRFENFLGFEEKSCSPHGCFGGQNCKQLRDQPEQSQNSISIFDIYITLQISPTLVLLLISSHRTISEPIPCDTQVKAM